MKYLPTTEVKETADALCELERRLHCSIVNNEKRYKESRLEILTEIAKLREELVAIGIKFDEEKQSMRQRRANAKRQFESE